MDVTRSEFLKKLARLALVSLLALIALILGSRTTTGKDCSGCAGLGLCKGEEECSKFLQKAK